MILLAFSPTVIPSPTQQQEAARRKRFFRCLTAAAAKAQRHSSSTPNVSLSRTRHTRHRAHTHSLPFVFLFYYNVFFFVVVGVAEQSGLAPSRFVGHWCGVVLAWLAHVIWRVAELRNHNHRHHHYSITTTTTTNDKQQQQQHTTTLTTLTTTTTTLEEHIFSRSGRFHTLIHSFCLFCLSPLLCFSFFPWQPGCLHTYACTHQQRKEERGSCSFQLCSNHTKTTTTTTTTTAAAAAAAAAKGRGFLLGTRAPFFCSTPPPHFEK